VSIEIKEAEKQALLQELIDLTYIPTEQPGDIRLQDIADKMKINRSSAKARFKKLVDSGELIEQLVVCEDKRQRIVYRKPQ
jgi:DNA-binding MarR family transcriptional regulator